MSRVLRFLQWAARSELRTTKPRRHLRGASAYHPYHRRLGCEALEERRLLSVSPKIPPGWRAEPPIAFTVVAPHVAGSTPQGLTPNQVRDAYGLGSYTGGGLSNGIKFDGIQGDGRGQTIAIVDAYDDPNAVTDVNFFSSYYGLPKFGGAGNPSFTKLNEYGGKALPTPDVPGGWGVEESLDIEWAHSMAPMANIILFEAIDASDNLYTAVQTAANTAGVVCISMSWSGAEFDGETGYDSYFLTPAGHIGGAASLGGTNLPGGVTFLAAAGDAGAYDENDPVTITPQYPDASPNVISVGGTTLAVNGSNPNYTYGGETTWGNGVNSGFLGGGGGGISAFESQPAFQKGVVTAYSATQRTYPDVSAEANNVPGVAVYDTYDFGGWVPSPVGGTSLATPMWAAMISVADEFRAIDGLGSLDGPSQTLPDLYKLSAADFHDITTGNATGPSPLYNPGPGYDLATGIGSPVANLLIPALCPKGPGVTGIVPNWGPLTGGTTVTITGYGLTNASAVDFGGVPATIISDTVTQIVATSPAGTGTVDVTVTTPDGTSKHSSADQFSYVVTLADAAEINASNGAAESYFGRSVAVSGNTMVVGAPFTAVGNNVYQGAAYVFTGSGSTWTQTAELTATIGAANSYFGQSVSISGNTIVIGAIGDKSYRGAAYVFTWSGSTWTQAAKLVASDAAAQSYFGSSVAVSGTTIVVGADGATIVAGVGLKAVANAGQGAAYVFTQSGSTWTQAAKLTASDGAAGDYFGSSVSISGNTVAVGAYWATINGNNKQGAVYVFTEPASGWARMTQTAKLTAADGTENNFLGLTVAISGNTVVLGAYLGTTVGGNLGQGAVYVFTEPASGWTSMTQSAELVASDGEANDFFGDSVAISGNTIVVGAWGVSLGAGSAYVFTQSGSAWTQTDQLTASGTTEDNVLGESVAISGNAIVVGAPLATVGTNASQGAAYIYSLGPSPAFTITGAASGKYVAGQTIPVQWTAANVPSGSRISLAYETTNNAGTPQWIEINGVTAANGSGSYNWNTAGLAPGTYYVAGYLYTPSSGTEILSHLTTSFTVSAAKSAAAPGSKSAAAVVSPVSAAVSNTPSTIHDQALLAYLQPEDQA